MNKEVNFEIAKLLKEKGFNEPCRFGYNGSFEPYHIGLIEFSYLQQNSELLELTYLAPIIAEVVMWLYEKHGVWINVDVDINGKFRHIVRKYNSNDRAWEVRKSFTISEYCNSPIEAYEAAIKYTLENLI